MANLLDTMERMKFLHYRVNAQVKELDGRRRTPGPAGKPDLAECAPSKSLDQAKTRCGHFTSFVHARLHLRPASRGLRTVLAGFYQTVREIPLRCGAKSYNVTKPCAISSVDSLDSGVRAPTDRTAIRLNPFPPDGHLTLDDK